MVRAIVEAMGVRNLVVATGLSLCSAIAAAAGDLPPNPLRDCNSMGKPNPGCLPLSGRITPPVAQDQPRRLTDEEIEKDKLRQKERAKRAAAIPRIHLSPDEIERETKAMKENADITLASNRQTLSASAHGSKYTIFLNDEKYPVRSLTITCDPRNVAAIGRPSTRASAIISATDGDRCRKDSHQSPSGRYHRAGLQKPCSCLSLYSIEIWLHLLISASTVLHLSLWL